MQCARDEQCTDERHESQVGTMQISGLTVRSDVAGEAASQLGRRDGVARLFARLLRVGLVSDEEHLRQLLLGRHFAQRTGAHALVHDLDQDAGMRVGGAGAEEALYVVLDHRVGGEAL
eukprot:CAMPEP_0174730440 /NCGR_PEP_ID=MMETSP1094-20130205/55623_1 /TAXON_ID=156173 /ORGANISM="Chrysochromulina brevifilum, Strain UTEX LB 985" /LENGTH=117 /DNA_ID=CAMNT_0015932705 /DNA_START=176 /DNA_END=529 /DNA_ORIENTATION=+